MVHTIENRTYFKRIFFLLLFIQSLFVLSSHAQMTRVRGKITEAETGEAIPFANVIFKGTNTGTSSEADGSYLLQTAEAVDSMIVSFIGFESKTVKVVRGKNQKIDIQLGDAAITLDEVVVVPDAEKENPAHRIMRNIWAHKEGNRPDHARAYEYEKYEKIEFDINNIDEKFKNRKIFKPFDFVFNNLDTSEVNGKVFLPIFIMESIYDYYYKDSPELSKEKLKASKVAGFNDNQSVKEFMKSLYQDINIYDNYVRLFDKGFISPISSRGLFSYHYFLSDSAYIDNKWCYRIQFIPKRKKEPNFTGDFWVNDTTWAIKSISMKVASDVNVNFINDIAIKQEFQQVDYKWMLQRDHILIDFSLNKRKDTKGLYGKKTTSYKNVIINQPRPDSFYRDEKVFLDQSDIIFNQDADFWNASRHEELSDAEAGIYTMIDTLVKVPAFKTYYDIIAFILSGYWERNGYDLGPVLSAVSFNPVEGLRLRVGGRTYTDLNDRFRTWAYVAYGFKDEQWKYSIETRYLLSQLPRTTIGVAYKHDIEQLAQSSGANAALSTGNFLSSALVRNPNNQLTLVREFKTYFSYELVENLNLQVGLSNRNIKAVGELNFDYYSDVEESKTGSDLITSELMLGLDYTPGRRYIGHGVERNAISAMFPSLSFRYRYGPDDIFNSHFEYHKFYMRFRHPFLLNPLGKMIYTIEAGKTVGEVPLPLLEIHSGNETYAYSQSAFNTMNYFEFVSDQYVGIQAEHHFMGLFFNKVPFLRKLNWREVVSAKAVIGSVSNANKALSVSRDLKAPTQPYYEVGGGIENIFKMIRLEAVWRLSYLDHPDIEKFGLRAAIEIRF